MVDIIGLALQTLISNPLTVSLVILGVICVVLAIIGKIPPINIEGLRALGLAGFGLFLIVVAVVLAMIITPPSPSTDSISQQPITAPTSAIGNQSTESSSQNFTQSTATPSQTNNEPLQIEPFCAFVTISQVEELKNIQGVSSAISKTEEFAGFQQNNYKQGETVPANVLIATDLLTTNIEPFNVIPINRQGGWGLFVTTSEIQAPNDGTYWCIHEQ